MDYLIFQLQAPLSSWGETAVGEYRPTANYPSESALLGLIAAALGISREDEVAHKNLHTGYGFAVGVLSAGRLLRDYHTSQVPGRVALKNRPHHTRRDELNMPKDELNTILSTRDYRQGAACFVAVQANSEAPYSFKDILEALQKPRYVLYLGRRSCPPAVPLWPQIIAADHALGAIESYRIKISELVSDGATSPLERFVWGKDIISGCAEDLQLIRKDRLLSREHWQFGDRQEHVSFLGGR